MSKVRVLVGTRKGAFILTSDGKREKWDVSGPHFAGWEIYHLEGFARRSQSDLCLADQRLVRPDHPALRRRRQDLAPAGNAAGEPTTAPDGMPKGESNKFVYDTSPKPASRSPRTSGTTARSIPGSSSASGTWSRRSPIPTRFTPALKTPPSSARPTAARTGTNWPACAATAPAPSGSRARAACACTRSSSIPSNPEAHLHRHLGRGRVPHRRRRQDLEADQPRPAARSTSPTRRRGRPLRAPHRACTRSRPDVLFMQKHWDVLRSRRRRRQLEGSQRQPAHRFRLCHRRSRARAGDDLRRPDQERLATLSRPTASCASSAAAPAATSGSRSPRACRRRTAT